MSELLVLSPFELLLSCKPLPRCLHSPCASVLPSGGGEVRLLGSFANTATSANVTVVFTIIQSANYYGSGSEEQVYYQRRHPNGCDEKKCPNTTTTPDIPSQPTSESKPSGPLRLESATSPKPIGSRREYAGALSCSKHRRSDLHAHL